MNQWMKGTWLVLLLCSLTGYGQHCGTTIADQKPDNDYVKNHRAEWSQYLSRTEGAITYIPIKFHRVYKRDGTGAVSYNDVLQQLCVINEDFAPIEIQFYLKDGIDGIIDLLNDEIYEDPNTSRTSANLRSAVNRNMDAVNIFITNSANSGSGSPGQTLGFYNRSGDYIVMKKTEIQSATHAVSHELGHFFGLSHTFYGWEGTEYDCSDPTPQQVFLGGGAVLVEYVDRNKQRSGRPHCQQSADGFCDTQADYNLGFGFSGGCNYNGCAKDPDGVSLMPDEENMMGYFLSCISDFSQEQTAVMINNYQSSRRNYIRSSYVPDLNPIPNVKPEIEHPLHASTTEFYDLIELRWKAVPGVTTYLVEVDDQSSLTEPLISEFVNGTSLVIEDLRPNGFHFWRVRPVTEYQNCLASSGINRFRTSNTTPTIDIAFDQDITLINNPATLDQGLYLESNSLRNDIQIDIFDLSGQKLWSRTSIQLSRGINQIPHTLAQAGIYMVAIQSGHSYAVKKWVIQ